MSYPLFTGIFLNQESKKIVKECFVNLTNDARVYKHFYCRHITVFRRPEYPEISFSESEPVVDCFLTGFAQDPVAQVFEVSIPFKHNKRFTHLTYAIEEDPNQLPLGISKPICKPCYGGHIFKHLHGARRGHYTINPEIAYTEFPDPIKISGNLVTIMEKSPYKPNVSVTRYLN
tara:strand:- start:6363 stop:6884 length:522 start_codon:yes stop_codon:yes gene_type:complete